MRLKNKIVLITGSAQGIGQAIASLFAKEGAKVFVSDIQDDKGKQTCNDINANTANCEQAEYIHLDVAKESDWINAMHLIQQTTGKLDVLVNNAGITGFLETTGAHDPENVALADWHKVHAVNLDGVALGCKHAIAMMKERGGSIVNISSRSGMVGIPMASAYASSKAGVRNHSKTVALYCAQQGYGIRCNSVHPGAILTPMWDAMLGEGEQRQQAIAQVAKDVPLGCMGDTADVAYATLYLASDESKYVTGIELTIDGGILAGSTTTPN